MKSVVRNKKQYFIFAIRNGYYKYKNTLTKTLTREIKLYDTENKKSKVALGDSWAVSYPGQETYRIVTLADSEQKLKDSLNDSTETGNHVLVVVLTNNFKAIYM